MHKTPALMAGVLLFTAMGVAVVLDAMSKLAEGGGWGRRSVALFAYIVWLYGASIHPSLPRLPPAARHYAKVLRTILNCAQR